MFLLSLFLKIICWPTRRRINLNLMTLFWSLPKEVDNRLGDSVSLGGSLSKQNARKILASLRKARVLIVETRIQPRLQNITKSYHERTHLELQRHPQKGCFFLSQNLIQEHRFHFIGLQETMAKNCDDRILRKFDPRSDYLWKWIPSKGKSGGKLSGINVDLFDVGAFHEGKYMLQLNLWDKTQKKKWNFINVYGAAQQENKDEFLAELANFCSKNNDPYVIGGD